MVEYNVVKYCSLCSKRFVVGKRDARKMYCDDCQKKVDEQKEIDSSE
ncbi:MAG: hypothetical protein ACQESE_04715 [Nanobdellota archaeon]